MKALTLWQPWASLVAEGHKRVETRSWSTEHRGPLAIHAAARTPPEGREFARTPLVQATFTYFYGSNVDLMVELPHGCVLAVVHLLDVVPTEFAVEHLDAQEIALGNYEPGRFAWHFGEPIGVPHVRTRGRQRLWNLDDALIPSNARKAVRHAV